MRVDRAAGSWASRMRGRWVRLLRIATGIAIAASVVQAGGPGFARAAGNCGTDKALFAGWWSSPQLTGNEPEGVSAVLTYRSAASCQSVGGGHDASYSGWVMVQGNGVNNKYAQSGFEFNGNPLDCIRHFAQYQNGAAGDSHIGSCVSAGEVHTPAVKFIAVGSSTQMWIDTTLFLTMNACSCAWPRPLIANYSGEVHNVNGDVPGLAASKTDWGTMKIEYFSDDTWHGTCGTITLKNETPAGRYAADAPACNHVRSWTAQP